MLNLVVKYWTEIMTLLQVVCLYYYWSFASRGFKKVIKLCNDTGMSKKTIVIEFVILAVMMVIAMLFILFVIYKNRGQVAMESWIAVVVLYFAVTNVVKRWNRLKEKSDKKNSATLRPMMKMPLN